MSMRELSALPVGQIAAENAVIFMWSTWANLMDAIHLIHAWGFQYRTNAWVWEKVTSTGAPEMGAGGYTRKCTEPCLLGARGRMAPRTRSERDLIHATNPGFNRKPIDQYQKIVNMYPDSQKIELFASDFSANCASAYGFDMCLGLEVNGDIRETLPRLIAEERVKW